MNNLSNLDFKRLPSIDRLLVSEDVEALIESYGRTSVKRVAQEVLQSMRSVIQQGGVADISIDGIGLKIKQVFEHETFQQLRPVMNLSGTLIHTNLGRASLPQAAIDAVLEVMRSPSNLEYDLETGRRGSREGALQKLICEFTGAEAATVVNNNAAAVMLVLNTLALAKQVPVSRGELVEIGGSFRIPDIMARSGCELKEVGTTNRTHLSDYSGAINPQTALIMKVHQSNYVIQGFTAEVSDSEVANLCAESDIPFVVDLGSGTLVDLEDYGLPQEPTPMQSLNAGADIVTFSGDKLLGGPQAGIIVGSAELIRQINANPMKRALRCDKMTIAALSALLKLYRHPETLAEQLPVLKLMTRDVENIRTTASSLVKPLKQKLSEVADVELIDCKSEIGSGAMPDHLLASVGVAICPRDRRLTDEHLSTLSKAFRRLPVPVIGRINKGKFILDCRSLDDSSQFIGQLSELDIGE